MPWVILCLLILLVMAVVLLQRAVRRLIQYDDIFQAIMPVLAEYSSDLERMSSADLDGILVDHPEVLNFHRRNRLAKQQVESLVDSITKLVPERKKAQELPRPDVE